MDTATMTNALLEVGEGLKPVVDFIDGQRQEFLRRGYSETAAEEMAVELFRGMVGMIFSKSTPATTTGRS